MKYPEDYIPKIRFSHCIQCTELLDLLEDDICSRDIVDNCEGVGGMSYIEHRCLSHGDVPDGWYIYKGSEDYKMVRSLIDGG